jgi:hypothetical protein
MGIEYIKLRRFTRYPTKWARESKSETTEKGETAVATTVVINVR